jgi:hypothetical protein
VDVSSDACRDGDGAVVTPAGHLVQRQKPHSQQRVDGVRLASQLPLVARQDATSRQAGKQAGSEAGRQRMDQASKAVVSKQVCVDVAAGVWVVFRDALHVARRAM